MTSVIVKRLDVFKDHLHSLLTGGKTVVMQGKLQVTIKPS